MSTFTGASDSERVASESLPAEAFAITTGKERTRSKETSAVLLVAMLPLLTGCGTAAGAIAGSALGAAGGAAIETAPGR